MEEQENNLRDLKNELLKTCWLKTKVLLQVFLLVSLWRGGQGALAGAVAGGVALNSLCALWKECAAAGCAVLR